ncbi:MAG: TSUP family transporter [Crocinitomix sp.]|nr:TSUP family transporter [Crocinitomix sp.]
MELIEIFGYLGALIIGIVLGLIGGGGSILTVPILYYVMGISPVLATAYSLFVVGTASLVGAIVNARKGMVDFRTGIVFAIPALLAVFLTRRYLVPAIPEELFRVGDFVVTKDISIMVFFAIIMLLASYSMIKGRKDVAGEAEAVQYNYPLIILEGIVVGVLTGIVGAGGGFLIIPALVLLAKLPMKKAVATSLMIIAVKSLFGFLGDVQNTPIDWPFLLIFTGISVSGIFIGLYLNKFIEGNKLKKGFGWFVLIMGIYIVLKETIFKV